MCAAQLNMLDELMCTELKEEGKPDHTAYGIGAPRPLCCWPAVGRSFWFEF